MTIDSRKREVVVRGRTHVIPNEWFEHKTAYNEVCDCNPVVTKTGLIVHRKMEGKNDDSQNR